MLLVAVCYAIGPLIASRKLSGLPPVGMTAACLAFAAVVYAPLAALTWTSALPSVKVLAAVAGLAVICTAVAFRLPARSPRGGVGESSPVGEQRDDAGLRMLARNCGRPDLGATAGSRVRLALILGDGRYRRLSKSTAPSRW